MVNPAGWGDDKLSDYLQRAHNNTLAGFANLGATYDRLRDIDSTFHVLLEEGLDNLQEPGEVEASLFCFRSHAAFRAAARLALAGQVFESYAVDRTALECALYGLFVSNDPNLFEIWRNRHLNAEARRTARRMFRIIAVLEHLEQVNPGLGAKTKVIYNLLIDFGGHPNPAGLLASAESTEDMNGGRIDTVYLHDNEIQLQTGIKNVARTGVVSLGIVVEVYPVRSEILGITARLPRLARGL